MNIAESGMNKPARAKTGVGRLTPHHHSGYYIWSHRRLLFRITRGELFARYAGSVIGPAWAMLAPALILAVYALVYLQIFRVRVPGLDPAGYVLFVFAGLVPYLASAEAIASGVASVITNKSVLNNTVFPIDLAPVKAVFLSQVTLLTGLVITAAGVILTGHAHWTLLLVPILWLLLVVSLIGINWILSLLTVVFRDLQNLVAILLMVTLIASPIAYTQAMVPASVRGLLLVNPFAYYVIGFQDLLVDGRLPSLNQSIAIFLIAVITFSVGGWFFARTRPILVDYV